MQTNQEFDIQTHVSISLPLHIPPSPLVCHCAWTWLHAQWHAKEDGGWILTHRGK